jgi:7tm Chemosensory receptor
LSRAKPLSGLGFFFIDKPMIVSIIGAAITYIIVLLQFNMSEIPNSKSIQPVTNASDAEII